MTVSSKMSRVTSFELARHLEPCSWRSGFGGSGKAPPHASDIGTVRRPTASQPSREGSRRRVAVGVRARRAASRRLTPAAMAWAAGRENGTRSGLAVPSGAITV